LGGSDNPVGTPRRAPLKHFINIRFPIRDINPLDPDQRLRPSLQAGHPACGLTRSPQPSLFGFALWLEALLGPTPALLARQSQDRHGGYLVPVPVRDTQGQGVMHQKAFATLVVDWPQVRSGHMGVEAQRGGVLHQQVLTRGQAGLGDALTVRGHNRLMGDVGFGEQPIGGTQIGPRHKSAGQGAVGILSQSAGHTHQAFGAPAVADLDAAEFLLRPKQGGLQEVRIKHIPPPWQVYKKVQ